MNGPSFANGMRHFLSMGRRQPRSLLLVVLVLGLGVGVTGALFGVIRPTMFASLPYAEQERLVYLWQTDLHRPEKPVYVTYPDFREWSEHLRSFDGIGAAFIPYDGTLRAGDSPSHQVKVLSASPELLPLLRLGPEQGRLLTPKDNTLGAPSVAMLSHEFWLRQGGDPNIVGQQVRLDGVVHEVVGVLPAAAAELGALRADVWVPIVPELSDDIRDDILYKRTAHPVRVIGRLKEGVSLRSAQQELDALARNIAEQQPKTNADLGALIVPMQGFETRNLAGPLLGFGLLCILVLAVSISNVTSLQLAQLRGRLAELALRACLGATRRHLVAHQLGEAVALGACVALTSLPIAAALLRTAALLNPIAKIDASAWSFDAQSAIFVLLAALSCGMLSALLPLVLVQRIDLARGLSSGPGRHATQRGDDLRRALLVCQAVLAVMVASVAANLTHEYAAASHADIGMNTDGIAVARIVIPSWKVPPRGKDQYPQWPALAPEYARIEAVLQATPGLASVALAQNHPQLGNWSYRVEIEGAAPSNGAAENWQFQPTGPRFLEMLGVPLLRGRGIAATDVAGSAPVVLINRSAAERYFAGENPLGKRVRLFHHDAWREIVGVVGDMHVAGPNEPVQPTVIPVLAQTPIGSIVAIARGPSSAATLVPILREAILKAEPDATVEGAEPLSEAAARLLAPQRFAVWMCSLPAFWILLLTLAGLVGVVALDVVQRRAHIAVHIALGATRARVLSLILRRTLTWFGAGVALGLLVLNWVAAPLGRSLGLALSPSALLPVAIAATLMAVALLASLIPARRALMSSTIAALQGT